MDINKDAPVAQLVEQLPLKETVVGSTPTGRTSKLKFYLYIFLCKFILENF
jgi:hypothetical protein